MGAAMPADILPSDEDAIDRAAALLRDGAVVGLPTETVYGLGGDATDDRAVARIFEAKRRPEFNPLIAHVPALETARKIAEFQAAAERLADAFWPGPLTLVLPSADGSPISELARAGLDTIAVRAPAHPVMQAVLRALDRPIAAPSANKSGEVSPTSARHVLDSLGADIPLILDGGPSEIGIESTIVALTGGRPRLLREGACTQADIEAVIGAVDRAAANDDVAAPGMMSKHYAPRKPLQLGVEAPSAGAVLLGFGPHAPADCLNLSPDADLVEAAANLYRMVRELDSGPGRKIQVMPIPRDGLGAAINDRLERAAAPE